MLVLLPIRVVVSLWMGSFMTSLNCTSPPTGVLLMGKCLCICIAVYMCVCVCACMCVCMCVCVVSLWVSHSVSVYVCVLG